MGVPSQLETAMPTIKFWIDGMETVDGTEERPLTDAERAEIARKDDLSKWRMLVEKAAGAAAVLSAGIGIFGGDKSLRHRCDWIAVAFGVIAMAVKFVAGRRS